MARYGINNNGNECFLNVVLQCLSVSPFIRDFIKQYSSDDIELIKLITKFKLGNLKADCKSESKEHNIKFACMNILSNNADALLPIESKILQKLQTHSKDVYIYISFKDIMRQLSINNYKESVNAIDNSTFVSINQEITNDNTIYSHLFNGSQNDPHEFLIYILEVLNNAKSSKIQISLPADINEKELNNQLFLKQFKSQYENDYSQFVKNLYFYILTCIQCSKCNNITSNFIHNNSICISIPTHKLDNLQNPQNSQNSQNSQDSQDTITLYDCLDDMFKVESIDYKCEKCGNCESNHIDSKIYSKPKTLIIKLKRYISSPDGRRTMKFDKMVQYPKSLNINKYLCGTTNNYKLYAIINHSGSLNGGHYYSFVKNLQENNNTFEDQWICCNDSFTKNISEEESMTSRNAYMLFYTLDI